MPVASIGKSRMLNMAGPINWLAPLNRGLVGHWLCLPGAMGGRKLLDLCGQRSGTLTSMSPESCWVAPRGRPGGFGALNFAGSATYVSVPSIGITTNNFTMSCWSRPTTITDYDAMIGCQTPTIPTMLISGHATQPLGYNWESTSDEYLINSGLLFTLNEWHFCALSVTPTAATLFMGKQNGSMSSFTNTKTHNAKAIGMMEFGSERTFFDHFWFGDLDDFRIYNRALSLAELQFLCQASRLGYPRELNWMDVGRWAQAGGGTTYTFASSDSIAYSDSLAVLTSSFRAASDSIGITDDAVRACEVFRTSEDNVALSDTVDRACQNLRAVEDNVACSDTVERVVEYFRAVADSIGIADEVLREISGIREISVADSLALSEAYLQVVSYFRDLAESLAFTDDFQRQVDYYRQVSDSIAILEQLITALNGIVITPPEEEEEEAEALDVEEDLYAYLLGCHLVTDLIGTRLYPVEAPKEATRPFIIYEILTRDRDDTQAGENGLVRAGIQFDCQAATYTAVREIEEALRGRFYRFYHQYMGTTFVQSAEISDATDEDSPPVFADAQGIYHSRVDLELWYEEPVPA